MAIKGQKSVTRCINKFLAQFDLKATMTDDFCYHPDSHLIEYSFFTTPTCTKQFMNSINRLNPIVKMDELLWSLLHEVGHHYTMNTIDEDTYDEIWDYKHDIEKGKYPLYHYYDLLDERLATEWAVEYANTHTEELEAFWNELKVKILNFYLVNGVLDEE